MDNTRRLSKALSLILCLFSLLPISLVLFLFARDHVFSCYSHSVGALLLAPAIVQTISKSWLQVKLFGMLTPFLLVFIYLFFFYVISSFFSAIESLIVVL
jgi:hypothetical protein